MTFVPEDFDAPLGLDGPGFHLEPLGPRHNERDHEAWMSSIEHIRATPGFPDGDWPTPMTLAENQADLERHARHFAERVGFTYSVVDGDDVIGCVYIYPSPEPGVDATLQSWVRASRAEMDEVVRHTVSEWLTQKWPFVTVDGAVA
jgi:hypothetical protein